MTDKPPPSPPPVDTRRAAAREREDKVVTAAIRDLDPIRRAAETGDVDRVSAGCDTLSARLRRPEFPRGRAKELVAMMIGLRRVAYMRKVDDLMVQAIVAAQQGDITREADMLAKSRDYIVQAVRCGADGAFRNRVERRMAALTDMPGYPPDPTSTAVRRSRRRAGASAGPRRPRRRGAGRSGMSHPACG